MPAEAYVEVAVLLPVRETFHYRLPKSLQEKAVVGSRVRVPFGHRDVEGVIVGRPDRPEVSRVKPVRALLDEEPLFRPDLLELGRWIAKIYQTAYGEALAAMLPAPIRRPRKSRRPTELLEEPPVESTQSLTLTPDQSKAYEAVRKALAVGRHKTFLLYGITSSGKTEVYLQAIHRVLESGRSAIVLVPEISLTPQAVERFRGRFGWTQVAVLHSALSDAQRASEWRRIRSGRARLVIGARSAVFAPVDALGLIVVDEEHEPSYKQEDAPRYHAREVALERARLSSAVVLLGSATPSLESFSEPSYHLLELPSRIDHTPLAEVQIVDLRRETFHGRAFRIFSTDLERALTQTLETRQQAILFLNRRGFSTFVHCRGCGYVLRCDLCRLPLIYHLTRKTLVCHTCSQNLPAPEICPSCRSGYVRFQGTGTERVESELARLFPKASIVRMDSDATRIRGAHAQILKAFSDHKIDVLIGTQMIAKGLDVPRVTLVGVISADTSLNHPDFRAAERTFNLLTQVAGRAGRGSLPGKVIIQTYTPHHYAILAAQKQDYRAFYQQEIRIRQELSLPPFTRLVHLTVRAMREEKAVRFADRLSRTCRDRLPPQVHIFGPAPAPIPKLRRFFRWQILLKTPTLDPITDGLPPILQSAHPPAGCYLAVDVDPL